MGDRTLDDPKSSYTKAQEASQAASQGPKYPSKRLIVCCDGTWNAGDDGQPLTNVAKIARCIADVDIYKGRNFVQIVHYQPGVGTGTGWMANKIDAMTGRGISKDIRAAYSFICLNWSNTNDEIVLIGFSRGAFTVRCIAQFMQEVGLLTKSGLRHLPKLFDIWRKLKPGSSTYDAQRYLLDLRCKELRAWGELVKEDKPKDKVWIQACVVWDTVRAVAQVFGPRFHTVGETVPKNIKFAVQALAIDEKRNIYKPIKWNKPQDSTVQTLSQRWFAGTHSDVGGGNKDMTNANITLAWMIGQLTDTIDFNLSNLWAITTTRSWSKPSPVDDLAQLQSADSRICKVVAKTQISPDLLRSEISWLSRFTRLFGNLLAAPSRRPDSHSIHWSVYVLRHLGIAKPARQSLGTGDEHGSKNASTPTLHDVSCLIPQENKFEGQILEKWAKHILCAHVNLNQARNFAETIESDDARYQKRVKAQLRREGAIYEAKIPTSAILSGFHKIARKHGSSEGETSNKEELGNICRRPQEEVQRPKTWKQYWNKTTWKQEPTATFEFTEVPKIETASSNELLEELFEIEGESKLVFTKTFPLLMGRAHELEPEPKLTWQQKAMTKLGYSANEFEIQGCEKCAKIWEPEKIPSQNSSNTEEPQT